MRAFVTAKRRLTVHLRPEDVRDTLGRSTDLSAVADAHRSLEE